MNDLRTLIDTIESINSNDIENVEEGYSQQSLDNLTEMLLNGNFGFSDISNRIESMAFKLKNKGYDPKMIKEAVSAYLQFINGHLDDLI